MAKRKPKAKPAPYGTIQKDLAKQGVVFDPWDQDFRRNGRRLAWSTVLRLLPKHSEDLICSWAEDYSWRHAVGEPPAKSKR